MFKSLRWRLHLWHAFILCLVVFGFGILTYWHQHHERFRQIDDELAAAIEVLVGKLQAAPPSALSSLIRVAQGDRDSLNSDEIRELEKLERDLRVPDTFGPRHRHHRHDEFPYFVIWSDDHTILQKSEPDLVITLPSDDDQPISRHRDPHPPRPQQFRRQGRFREAYAPGPPGVTVLVGRSIVRDVNGLHRLAWMLGLIGLIVMVVGMLGGWLLSTQFIRPIESISRVASEISATNLSKRIDIEKTDDELGQLAETLNQTFDRLESAFQQQVQFTSDASHELRTPLTIALTHQELALSKTRTADEYRKSIETSHRATKRMQALVDSLLSLARLDANALNLNKQIVSLVDLVQDAVELVEPLATSKKLSFQSSGTNVSLPVDPEKLSQVFVNLLTNAIQHSPEKGTITISLTSTDDQVTISIGDQGPGIPASAIPHLFRRFFRVDEERSRDLGGSGLGLAICKSIVESHQGNISVESSAEGSTFIVHLPRKTSAAC